MPTGKYNRILTPKQIVVLEKMRLGNIGRKHPHTEEAKRKIGLASKGNKYCLGRKASEESKLKMSLAHKGIKLSKETRNKMSIYRKGRKTLPCSEETKRKLSEYNINHPQRFWLGKKRPEISRENNNNWKGGITSLVQKIRHCFKYREWRDFIFQGDNYTCQNCGARNGNGKAVILNADHYPKMFSTIIEENNIRTFEEAELCEELWNINNGRTLCVECHRTTFIWHAKKNN